MTWLNVDDCGSNYSVFHIEINSKESHLRNCLPRLHLIHYNNNGTKDQVSPRLTYPTITCLLTYTLQTDVTMT